MLKLPKNFPVLEEPYLIVAASIWFQLFLILFIVCISIAGIFWFILSFDNIEKIRLIHYFGLIISLWLLSTLFSKNVRVRWVGFAADANGIYVANRNRVITFVPWGRTGDSRLAGNNTFGTFVIIKVKIDDYQWNKIPDENTSEFTSAPLSDSNKDMDGYRDIEIGFYGQSARKIRKNIEQLRQRVI